MVRRNCIQLKLRRTQSKILKYLIYKIKFIHISIFFNVEKYF